MKTTKKIILFILPFGLLAPALLAQTFGINWYKITGGGGASAGTNGSTVFTINGASTLR